MKKLLFILILFCSAVINVNGQAYTGPLGGNGGYYKRIDVDNTFGIPYGPTPIIDVTGFRETRPGRLFWKDTDATLWGWDGTAWSQIGGGSSVTIYTGDATITGGPRTVTIPNTTYLEFVSDNPLSIGIVQHHEIDYWNVVRTNHETDNVWSLGVDNVGSGLEYHNTTSGKSASFIVNQLGGTYTDNTIALDGIKYDHDIRATLVDNSLIPKNYVDDAIASLVTIYTGDATIDDENRTVGIVAGRSLTFNTEDASEQTRTIQSLNVYDILYRDKGDGRINRITLGDANVLMSVSNALNANKNIFTLGLTGGIYTGGISGHHALQYAADYSATYVPLSLITLQDLEDGLSDENLQNVMDRDNRTTLPTVYLGETGAVKYSWLYGADNAVRQGDPDFPDASEEFKWMLPKGTIKSHPIGTFKRTLATSLDDVFADENGNLSTTHLPFFYRHDGFMYNDPGTFNPDYSINEPDDGSRDIDMGGLNLRFTNSSGGAGNSITFDNGNGSYFGTDLTWDGFRAGNSTNYISVSNGFSLNISAARGNSIFDLGTSTDKGFLMTRLTTSQLTALPTTIADDGLLVYNTDNHHFNFWDHDAVSWKPILTSDDVLSFIVGVNGTTNRVTVTGTTTRTVDIASTYVGQTSITTLGTIGTGSWQGSVVGTTYGGTGLSSLGTSLQQLRVNSGGTALEYFTPTSITPAALTKTDDTNVTLTLGGTPTTALLQATSLTVGWSGQLSIARGGTGLSALGTANQLVRVNSGATALEYFTPSFLTSESDPVWLADKPSYLTSATAASTYQPLDGDLTSIAALTTTTFGRSLLTQADASATRTTLGLGTLATQSGTFSGTSSGTNTGDQTFTIAGDGTASGSTSTLTLTVTKLNGTSLGGLATGLLKNTTTTGVPSIAVSGTDYAPATSGSSILKGNGSGGFTNATGGTDYANASHTHDASDVTSGTIATARLGSGSATSETVLHGDNTWGAKANAFTTNQAFQALGSAIKYQVVGYTLNNITTSYTMVDAELKFAALYIDKTTTLTGVSYWQNTVGNYTGDQYNGVALYSYSGGTLTLVASSTNDATIWSTGGNNVLRSKAFSSTYSAAPGIYFVAFVYNNSAQTTAPKLGVCPAAVSGNAQSFDLTNNAVLQGAITGTTSLPTPQGISSVTASTQNVWVAVY